MAERRVLLSGGEGEIIEKKSRFIATVRPVATEEEAVAFFGEMKKKYWDAKHNCSAFVIGDNPAKTRCSDDGEPSGTAGRPMLEVLTSGGLVNAACVVTRYFGGTLLGTGGLVRAYTAAVLEGLKNCEIGEEKDGIEMSISFPYAEESRVRKLMEKHGVVIRNTVYAADALFECVTEAGSADVFEAELVDVTAGKAAVERLGECVFI